MRVADARMAATGGLLLAVSWVVVALEGGVLPVEASTFESVNGLPAALWPPAWAVMQLGSLVGALVVVAVVQLVGRDVRLSLAALVASVVAWWAAMGVKSLVSRGRPGALLRHVTLRENATGLGYVSGHAAVAFALAAVLAPGLSRAGRVTVFAVATAVGLARLYAGVHLPLDVIGGAGLGLVSGTLSRWAFGLSAAGEG